MEESGNLNMVIKMIDITNYKNDKEKELIKVTKVGNAFVISKRQFDQNDGSEKEPLIQAFGKEQIEAEIKSAKDKIDRLEELLADTQKL